METALFKGQRMDGKGWVVGNLYVPNQLLRGVYISLDTTCVNMIPDLDDEETITKEQIDSHEGIMIGKFIEFNPETLCQFTGFTYKDQKVWQGDTFKIKLEDSVEPEGFYWWEVEVKQHLGCWILAQIGHDYKGTPIEQCELLFTTDYELVPTGNIHDKPQPNEN